MKLVAQDEWVISRVFQKNTAGGGSSSSSIISSAGAKKTRLISGSIHNHLYPEVTSSPSNSSTASLPPLLDFSPFSAAGTDRQNTCSYDDASVTAKEHGPCFSTTIANVNPHHHPSFDLQSRFQSRNGDVSAFPSLRSLQENLHLPFFSTVAPPPFPQPQMQQHQDCADHVSVISGGGGNWLAPSDVQKMEGGGPFANAAATELDCMWTY